MIKRVFALILMPVALLLASCGVSKVEEWDKDKKEWVYIGDCSTPCLSNDDESIKLTDGTYYAPQGRYRIVRIK